MFVAINLIAALNFFTNIYNIYHENINLFYDFIRKLKYYIIYFL